MASQRIGTFVVSDRIWENQSESLRGRHWLGRVLKIVWDDRRYWITAESILFDPVRSGEVIPDYEIEITHLRGKPDQITAKRLTVA